MKLVLVSANATIYSASASDRRNVINLFTLCT